MGKEIIALLWALVITVLILALAYWFTRHVVGRMAGGMQITGKGRQIAVLEQLPVSKEQKLLLVRMGKRVYFMASSQGTLSVLHELTEEEIADLPAPAETAGTAEGGSFAQTLRRMLEQRKK